MHGLHEGVQRGKGGKKRDTGKGEENTGRRAITGENGRNKQRKKGRGKKKKEEKDQIAMQA